MQKINHTATHLLFCLILLFLLSSGSAPVWASADETGPVGSGSADAPADDAGTDEPGSMAEWTVMLYLCGTDLETDSKMATENLKAIAGTEPSPEVNVVIETGGTREWHTRELGMDPDPSKLERWTYTEQGFQKVGETELASMGEQSTLEDFLSWTAGNYPARKYQLILWDHGGASINGVVFDELHDFGSLQLFDIAGALKNSAVHLECFMTDTCLMATLETAEAVAPYASYFVGCEESLPGQGCNYAYFLQYLYDFPECDGASLGKRICSGTEKMYSDMNSVSDLGFLTISLIDLSKVAAVRETFDDFIKEVEQLLDDPAAFYQYCYATRDRETYYYTDFADIYDLADLASGHGVSPKTAAILQNAVEEAVLYNVCGSNHVRSHGLMEFYCFNKNQYLLDHFSRVCGDPVYLAFLDRLSYQWKAPDWVYESVTRKPDVSHRDFSADLSVRVSNDNTAVSLEMPSEDSFIIEGKWELLQYDPDLDLWRNFGQDPFVTEEDDGTTLSWQSTFDGTWPVLGGVPLTLNLIDEQESYVLFGTPMKVDDKADTIRILYRLDGDDEDPQYRVIGSSSLDDHTGFPDRNTAPVEYGSRVEPLARLQTESGDTVLNCKTAEPFVYEYEMQVTREELPPGTYAVRFITKDIFGNESSSEMISCEWDGNKVVYEK